MGFYSVFASVAGQLLTAQIAALSAASPLGAPRDASAAAPVSYTHLTLPTILLV